MDIKCTQCGAKVPIEEDSDFIRCPYCETALYVETDRTIKHYYMVAQKPDSDLGPVIQRKISYMEIKDPVEVTTHKISYLPFWKLETSGGKVVVVPAAMTPLEGLRKVAQPAGELKLYSAELTESFKVVEPQALLEEAAAEGLILLDTPGLKFQSATLLHLPMYEVDYTCQNSAHKALVDAVSGEVYADQWPAAPQKQKDRFFGLIAVLALALFAVEAAVLPGFWLVVLAYAVTSGLLYFFTNRWLTKMGW